MMRKFMKIVEAAMKSADSEKMEEALWWVSRWVSGSEGDPDWDYGMETMTMDEAFLYIADNIKSKYENVPVLYRAIVVSRAQANKIIKRQSLQSNHRAFQSFTTKPEIAMEACRDIDSYITKGMVRLLVEVKNPKVLFALRDLNNTNIWDQLDDWHHQDEVFVDGRAAINIASATVFK